MSTGLSVLSTDLAGQRLDLLREITSEIRRVTDIAPAIHALKGDADALCLLRPAHIQQLELHQHLGVIDPFDLSATNFAVLHNGHSDVTPTAARKVRKRERILAELH